MSTLKEKIDVYVREKLNEYTPTRIRGPKVIHDTILGSNLFYPHEIIVLDLPLLQRLRRINQVDVVPLVFPSGNHNRFEHTLGVTVIADKLVHSLYRKQFLPGEFKQNFVSNHVRMAAILHDCGHGPFSHMSEEIFKEFEDFKECFDTDAKLKGASPHEVLSYLIVTSDGLKEFFKKEIEEKYNIEFDLEFIGEMIIGYISNPNKAFMVDIINGAFDADKLDYIQRDSHFTGIKMVLDIERLFHTIDVLNIDGKLRLTVDISGTSTLEQIVFNKMMLFSTVYHHHKVRAAECLFKSIIKELINMIKNGEIENFKGKKFDSAADFLALTDDDIYNVSKQNLGFVSELSQQLNNRRLPKRAMVISEKTVGIKPSSIEEGEKKESNEIRLNMNKIKSILAENPNAIKVFREAISEETKNLGYEIPENMIWIDIPDGPKFKEASQCPIKSITDGSTYTRLRDIFPVDDWTRAFSENKWKGYVFTIPDKEYREVVYKATENLLNTNFNIKINKLAWDMCKMD